MKKWELMEKTNSDLLINLIDTIFSESDEIEKEDLESAMDEFYYGDRDEIIYYDEAFEYLQDNNIYDFDEAIQAGYLNIVDIANFYKIDNDEKELWDAIDELYK